MDWFTNRKHVDAYDNSVDIEQEVIKSFKEAWRVTPSKQNFMPYTIHVIGPESQEWKNKLSYWISNPGPNEVLMSSIFFDYSLAYGERSLLDNMSEHIFRTVEKYPIFLVHLANGALQSPSPTGFFRQFLVEQDGQHKDFFDLKNCKLLS